jgi:predicted metal-dependent hydrolase
MIQPDEIIRSNRKTLSICIDPFGRLIVRAPKRCGQERIFAFLRQKEDWILRKKSERNGAGIRLPDENLDGYALPILGKEYRLHLCEVKKVSFSEQGNILYLPQVESEKKLVAWLKKQSKELFLNLTCEYAEKMQTSFKSVGVTSAKRRWGSCSFDNSLHFSFRLLFAPMEIVEYVIVHELAHTKHKNHSPRFWVEVEKYEPNYKEKRKWLKAHAGLMEIL